jgi:hypothetical protein
MKSTAITVIAAAVALAFSAAAAAENMSSPQYKAGKKSIEATYTTDKAGCDSLAANAKDICVAEAKGKEKVAYAELSATYKPSIKTRYDVRIAKANAAYSVAEEKCDDKAGNDKDVCMKEATAAQTAAKEDAKAQRKTAEANATATDKSANARAKADKKIVAARDHATEEKREANYAVAKEKCDSLAGNAKELCVNDAKKQFGKS